MYPPPQPTLPLNSDFGPYHLLCILGVGGMSEVYLARTKGVAGFERLLALKVINPIYAQDHRVVQMLIDEARLAIGLDHPNIAQMFDLGRIGDVYFVSMEYVDGIDYFKLLQGITEQQAEVPIGLALYVAREVCLGLEYAHRKVDDNGVPMNIIHRDVSPQNVLLSRRGAVKLVDFGIAKAASTRSVAREGAIKGKLVYMSPEQARGEDVDQRADIFSVGVVLYESLTGGSLYLEKNPIKLIKMVRKAEILPPSSRNSEISVELDALVMKALSLQPEKRCQTPRELAEAIAALMAQTGIEYSAAQLGAMVSAIGESVDGDRPREDTTSPRASRQSAGPMDRGDYPNHAHSMIVSGQVRSSTGSAPSVDRSSIARGARPQARVILLGETGEESHTVTEDFVIGRGGHLRLLNARVSRRHARIRFTQGRYLIEDLNSSNGTFINDEKVTEVRELRSRDMIRIGPFDLRFIIEEGRVAPLPFGGLQRSAVVPGPADPSESQLSVSQVEEPSPWIDKEDRTSPAGTAELVLEFSPPQEQIVIPLDRELLFDHHIGVGDLRVGGPAGRLLCQSDGYWIEPLPGREPVMLNGEPLRSSARLGDGDVVAVGPIQARFRAGVR